MEVPALGEHHAPEDTAPDIRRDEGIAHVGIGWIATSLAKKIAGELIGLYGHRRTVSRAFRDTKVLSFDIRFSATRIEDADRRHRVLLLIALAQAFWTELGQAGKKRQFGQVAQDKHRRKTHFVPTQPRLLLVQSVDQHAE